VKILHITVTHVLSATCPFELLDDTHVTQTIKELRGESKATNPGPSTSINHKTHMPQRHWRRCIVGTHVLCPKGLLHTRPPPGVHHQPSSTTTPHRKRTQLLNIEIYSRFLQCVNHTHTIKRHTCRLCNARTSSGKHMTLSIIGNSQRCTVLPDALGCPKWELLTTGRQHRHHRHRHHHHLAHSTYQTVTQALRCNAPAHPGKIQSIMTKI